MSLFKKKRPKIDNVKLEIIEKTKGPAKDPFEYKYQKDKGIIKIF